MNRPSRHWLRFAIALCANYSGLDRLYRRLQGAGLVVLMLHRIRDEADPYPLSVSTASLRQILLWLRAQQALVGLDEGLLALAQPRASRVHYSITLDDGYHDNLQLIDGDMGPVPAVIYVATDHIGGDPIWAYRIAHAIELRTRDHLDLGAIGLGHFDLAGAAERQRLLALLPERLKLLNPDEIEAHTDAIVEQMRPQPDPPARREMLDWEDLARLGARGIQIGGHTRRHVLLSRVDEVTARSEIRGSRARIAAELGSPPQHFAYPNGGHNDFGERDVQLVREAGFQTAATSIEGVNRRGVDHYRLLRHNVHEERYRAPSGRLSKALFFSETSGLLGWLRAYRIA